jgi:hypothetical protein
MQLCKYLLKTIFRQTIFNLRIYQLFLILQDRNDQLLCGAGLAFSCYLIQSYSFREHNCTPPHASFYVVRIFRGAKILDRRFRIDIFVAFLTAHLHLLKSSMNLVSIYCGLKYLHHAVILLLCIFGKKLRNLLFRVTQNLNQFKNQKILSVLISSQSLIFCNYVCT